VEKTKQLYILPPLVDVILQMLDLIFGCPKESMIYLNSSLTFWEMIGNPNMSFLDYLKL